MEILLLVCGLVGGLCWLNRLWSVRQPTSAPSPQELERRAAIARGQQQQQAILRRQQEEQAAARRRERLVQARQAADQRRRLLARNMQIAILQIDQSPDFRRAASHAELARDIPLAFRQKQFRRLRPLLLRHLVTNLRAGQAVDATAAGLAELVTALGIAEYEAEYLVQEASTLAATRVSAPLSFAQQAQQWQGELRQRLEVIQGLNDLDPDLREQLIEQEQQRFRERLVAAGDSASPNDRLHI